MLGKLYNTKDTFSRTSVKREGVEDEGQEREQCDIDLNYVMPDSCI